MKVAARAGKTLHFELLTCAKPEESTPSASCLQENSPGGNEYHVGVKDTNLNW